MRSNSRAFVAAVFGMTMVGSLEAQIIRRPVQTRRPTAWVSGSLGLLINNDVDDGSTGSYWEFAQAPIFRVGFEQALQGSSAYGLAGGIARVPLTYSSNTDVLCTSCDADAVVTQLL